MSYYKKGLFCLKFYYNPNTIIMRTKISILLISLSIILSACKGEIKKTNKSVSNTEVKKQTKGQSAVKDEDSQPNVLQTAKSIKDFSTLVTAIEKAGVEDSVVNAGPLTVFAPLNSAFDKLPKEVLNDLLKPENKSKLAFVLTNHVAPSNYPMKQLKKEARKKRKLYMASGEYLDVVEKGGKIFVGGVEVIKSVKVSNGWVHVINTVLVPKKK